MTVAQDILSHLEQELPWQRELYVDLHQNPELSFQEHRTAGIIEEKLNAFGYQVQRIGGTGVVGILYNGEGSTVLSRADIDALPVTEATGLPYASTVRATDATGAEVGVMHACGHDMHVATLLGAAKLMADHKDKWQGTYIALFQPAEEVAGGALAMVHDGLVNRIPRPDVALSQHLINFETGRTGINPGPTLSAGDSIKITLFGRGSHGSMPHNSVDPAVLASAVVLRLQGIVSREVAPGTFAVVTVGSVQVGSKSNIITDHATLLVNVRAYDLDVRAKVLGAIERVVRGECAASGSPAEPTFEYYDQYPLTSNDPTVTETVHQALLEHYGEQLVFTSAPATASEDFSHIPNAFGTPYTYWTFGGTDSHTYQTAAAAGRVALDIPANHSPFFAPVIDPTLGTGTSNHVVAAAAYLAK